MISLGFFMVVVSTLNTPLIVLILSFGLLPKFNDGNLLNPLDGYNNMSMRETRRERRKEYLVGRESGRARRSGSLFFSSKKIGENTRTGFPAG